MRKVINRLLVKISEISGKKLLKFKMSFAHTVCVNLLRLQAGIIIQLLDLGFQPRPTFVEGLL